MTTQAVADRYYALAQEGKYDQIQQELYSPDCVSIESDEWLGPKRVQGMEAIKAKGAQFNDLVEAMHSGYCNPPIVAGKCFACTMGMDVTLKGQGRMQMDEVCVFEVENGKIVLEQFFF